MSRQEEEKSDPAEAPLDPRKESDLKVSGDSNGCIYKPVHREDWPLLPGKKNGYGTYRSWGRREGITLTWQDLTVYVKEKKSLRRGHDQRGAAKEVLHNVCGAASPGSVTAVMGASGAGKTTLMNALAHRTERNMVVGGDIRVNGCHLSRSIVFLSGYLKQHNLFLGSLTVKEHLTFMACLRMDRLSTPEQREQRVKELLTELGLLKVQDTCIGYPTTGKSLSGGERKRLAFATEIINDPQLLFCDEPTTGLDSYNAEVVVKIMKNMAKRGKTIICTIHQPSSEVFRMFNRLALLAEGRLAFTGPSDSARQFFESLGHKCPATFNPADYYIHTLAVFPGHETRSRERIKRICDNFAVSAYCKDIDIAIQHQKNMQSNAGHEEESLFGNVPEKPGWLLEWRWLTWRSLLDKRREATVQTIRIMDQLWGVVVYALFFANLKLDQEGTQGFQGLWYSLVIHSSFAAFSKSIDELHKQQPLFFQEYKDKIYRYHSFYLSKMVALLIGTFFETMFFSVLSYWIIGLQPHAYHFTMALLILLLANFTASACAAMVVGVFEDFIAIMTGIMTLQVINIICSGLFLNLKTMSWFTGWMKYLTWLCFGNEVLTVTQWSDVKNITCDFPAGVPCISTGLEVIEKYAYQPSNLPFDFWWLVVLYCFYHFIGFIALYSKAKAK